MWLKKNDLCYHVGRVKVGLWLQLVFRSTCRALTRACPNTGTPCFRTFGPGTRTWPVFAQGGGGGVVSLVASRAPCSPMKISPTWPKMNAPVTDFLSLSAGICWLCADVDIPDSRPHLPETPPATGFPWLSFLPTSQAARLYLVQALIYTATTILYDCSRPEDLIPSFPRSPSRALFNSLQNWIYPPTCFEPAPCSDPSNSSATHEYSPSSEPFVPLPPRSKTAPASRRRARRRHSARCTQRASGPALHHKPLQLGCAPPVGFALIDGITVVRATVAPASLFRVHDEPIFSSADDLCEPLQPTLSNYIADAASTDDSTEFGTDISTYNLFQALNPCSSSLAPVQFSPSQELPPPAPTTRNLEDDQGCTLVWNWKRKLRRLPVWSPVPDKIHGPPPVQPTPPTDVSFPHSLFDNICLRLPSEDPLGSSPHDILRTPAATIPTRPPTSTFLAVNSEPHSAVTAYWRHHHNPTFRSKTQLEPEHEIFVCWTRIYDQQQLHMSVPYLPHRPGPRPSEEIACDKWKVYSPGWTHDLPYLYDRNTGSSSWERNPE